MTRRGSACSPASPGTRAKGSGRSLKLTAARPALLRIMQITGLDEAFPEVRNSARSVITLPRQAQGRRDSAKASDADRLLFPAPQTAGRGAHTAGRGA